MSASAVGVLVFVDEFSPRAWATSIFSLENSHWHMEEWVGFVEEVDLISGG